MEIPAVLSHPRYKIAAITAGILTLLYVLANLFVIGGDEFLIKLDDTFTIPLAILTAVCAGLIWNQVKASPHSRLLWGGLFIGWTLWALAEMAWAIYGYLGLEVPYPSVADFFWLAGYPPVAYGLYTRLKEMPIHLSLPQRITLGLFTLGVLVFAGFFVLLPILQNNDPTRLFESALNLFYPLVDLFLFIIAVSLLLVYRSGDYGFGWNLINAGFLLVTVSDLLFSYASTVGLYYPDGKVNLLSSLGIGVPYNLSYLVWVLGIYALSLTLSSQQPFEKPVQPRLVPNVHVAIFLRADDLVTNVSNNFEPVFGTADVQGKTLAELLQIPGQEVQTILRTIREHQKIADHSVQLGKLAQAVCLSGIAILDSEGEYAGSLLSLRLLLPDDHHLDEKLNDYQKSILLQVRNLSGSTEEAEIRSLLLDYHSAYLKQLYNLVFRTGGPQLSLVFLERLRETAKRNQWPLQFNPQTLLTQADYPLSLLQIALPVLLETARHFAAQLTDETELQAIAAQFSEAVQTNVAGYCARPAEIRARLG
jgi:hypothetical protein